MIVTLTPEEAAKVAQLPGVLRVVRNYTRYLQTDTSLEYLNAVGIWDGSNTGALPGTMGEGIVAGIIDTGINMDHPSFADVGDDGYDHTNPLGAGNYTGWCNLAIRTTMTAWSATTSSSASTATPTLALT